MFKRSVVRVGKWSVLFFVMLVLLMIAPVDAQRAGERVKPPKDLPPVSVEIVNAKKKDIPTLTTTGWTLDIRVRANDGQQIGILQSLGPLAFPGDDGTGFLTLDDLGCNSWIPPQLQCCNGPNCLEPGFGCEAVGASCALSSAEMGTCMLRDSSIGCDDRYVEFTAGIDVAGLSQVREDGNIPQQLRQKRGPQIQVVDFASGVNDRLVDLGPLTGPDLQLEYACYDGAVALVTSSCNAATEGEFCYNTPFYVGTCQKVPTETDGFGFGADDKLPGLVVVADTGVGIVYEEHTLPDGSAIDYTASNPLQLYNLAGLTNVTGYELATAFDRDVVLTAQIHVSGGGRVPLFSPLALIDDCVEQVGVDPAGCDCKTDTGPTCTGGPVAQIDGGLYSGDAWQSYEDRFAIRQALNNRVVTIRAWMCSGNAPDVLMDSNGDGVVNIEDAPANGCQVISDEEEYRIKQLHQDLFIGVDFDRDGNGVGLKVAPSGAFKATPIPR